MASLLHAAALRYFFGPQYNLDVALNIFPNFRDSQALEQEIRETLEKGTLHLGIQLVGYQNVDTGFSSVALVRNPGAVSSVSFFAESRHRLFGGQTLICVPLAFCTSIYSPTADHIVYRHTYKKPRFTTEELEKINRTGSSDQKMKAFLYTKSRDGYETIPGMSYVGITSRSWQERYLEHAEKALESESSTHFHNAIRQMQGQKVVCVHDVSAFGLTRDEAKVYESKLIAESTLWPRGLNMRV